jgi:hypothetical protein
MLRGRRIIYFDITCAVSGAVHSQLYAILARAGFRVDSVDGNDSFLRKDDARLFTSTYVIEESERRFCWQEIEGGRKYSDEVYRILYSLESKYLDAPVQEIYRSTAKSPEIASVCTEILTHSGIESSTRASGETQLSFGVRLYAGPSADPATGEPRDYIGLDYRWFSIRPFSRRRMLQQIRTVLRERGFMPVGPPEPNL